MSKKYRLNTHLRFTGIFGSETGHFGIFGVAVNQCWRLLEECGQEGEILVDQTTRQRKNINLEAKTVVLSRM